MTPDVKAWLDDRDKKFEQMKDDQEKQEQLHRELEQHVLKVTYGSCITHSSCTY